MPVSYAKAEVVPLKGHPEFSERWVQQRLNDDPGLLGLGDVEIVAVEKVQAKAGRLDLLLQDEQLNRRYEVELMLGATDPSHIIRCLEYYDIERRRYPAYDHVAVLVAEDITSRFLNVMALLSGSVPLIAIQFNALRIGDAVTLHFTRVLDQTELRSDDEYELAPSAPRPSNLVDRNWWLQRVPETIIALVDAVQLMVTEAAAAPHRLQYRKQLIDVVADQGGERRVWMRPKQTHLDLGAYVADAEDWGRRLEVLGPVALRRGNKAVVVALTPETHTAHRSLLEEFLCAAFQDRAEE